MVPTNPCAGQSISRCVVTEATYMTKQLRWEAFVGLKFEAVVCHGAAVVAGPGGGPSFRVHKAPNSQTSICQLLPLECRG